MVGGCFLWKKNFFALPCPKWDYHSFLFSPIFFFSKIKETESKTVWYAYQSWATTIEGFRRFVIMSNFKCGSRNKRERWFGALQYCHKFSSLMFEQGLWSALSFQNPFSWNKDWFFFFKYRIFFLKAEI